MILDWLTVVLIRIGWEVAEWIDSFNATVEEHERKQYERQLEKQWEATERRKRWAKEWERKRKDSTVRRE